MPVETERPIISELIARNQVVDIAISGAADLFTLTTIAERIHDLTALPEISHVDIVSAPPYEISIEVSEVALRRHRMTFDQVGARWQPSWTVSRKRISTPAFDGDPSVTVSVFRTGGQSALDIAAAVNHRPTPR